MARVRRVAARGGDGRDVDDRPNRTLNGVTIRLGLRDHAAGHRLAQAQRGQHILLKQCLDRGIGGIKRITDHQLPAGVDQNIDPVEGIDRGRDKVFHRQPLAQIAREPAQMILVIAHLAAFIGQPRLVAVGEHDLGPAIEEMARNGKAHAVGSTRHDRGLALNGKCHLLDASLAVGVWRLGFAAS